MNSMRNLNTSLPSNSPQRHLVDEPPEQLLRDFKAAATAVTKLYKTAGADQAKARSDGYQIALDELLSFLDRENIGLNDGEGWQVRVWATERLGGRDQVSQQNESDDESLEKADRASSPVLLRPRSTSQLPSSAQIPLPTRAEYSEPPPSTVPVPDELPTNILPAASDIFTFRSSINYPQEADVTLADLNLSDGSRSQNLDTSTHVPVPRPSRLHARNNNNNHTLRSTTRSTSALSRASGQKRKINPLEFFDFGRDFGGGGKRGRFT